MQGSPTPESLGHPQAPYPPAAYSTEWRSLNLSLEQALTASEPLTFQWNSAATKPARAEDGAVMSQFTLPSQKWGWGLPGGNTIPEEHRKPAPS